MSDFVSFNEFVDRVDSAKVGQFRETIAKALASQSGAGAVPAGNAPPELPTMAAFKTRSAFFYGAKARSVAPVKVSDDDVEAEFIKMKAFVLDRYKSVSDVSIHHSFLSPGGNFHDCLHFEQQPTYRFAKEAGHNVSAQVPTLNPSISESPGNPTSRGARVHSVLPPLRRGLEDQFGNRLECPEGRVPVRRITISQMARLGKFENFFRKYPAEPPFAGSLGTSAIHHHAVCNETNGGNYFACSTWANVWEVDPSPGVFSLSQLWLIGETNDGVVQTIESGWQIYPELWGTSAPALFVYYNPHGYDNTGGYLSNSNHFGFIQASGSNWIIGDAVPPPYSMTNGVQEGFQMLWQIDGQGNWWLFFGTGVEAPAAVGFFPAGLYKDGTLAHSGQTLQFGGEVCSQSPGTASYPATGKMGSGIPPFPNPDDSFREVAFHKQIGVSRALGSALVPASLEVLTDPRDAGYSAMQVSNSGIAGWDTFMYFGGAHSNWP